MRLWRCGKACHSRAFRPQTVYTRPPFPGGFRLLFAMDFGRAVSAVFCPPRASKDARAADFAAAKSFWVEDGSGRRSMGSSLCIFALLCDELCVRWVVQRNEGGLAQTLLAPNNQAAVLQLPEDPRGALAAAVEFGLCLLQGEVQPNCAVRLDVAVLPGNACSRRKDGTANSCCSGWHS